MGPFRGENFCGMLKPNVGDPNFEEKLVNVFSLESFSANMVSRDVLKCVCIYSMLMLRLSVLTTTSTPAEF